MSVRRGLLRVPSWVQTATGLALTAGLALVAAGAVVLPRWLAAPHASTPAEVERAASAAADRWQRAVNAVAAAKGVTPGEALIGSEAGPLVTTLGEIEAKRLSASPAWPRALVREFHRAGLRPGDVVAASLSGSFPGINLAVMSASEAMGLQLIAVSSVTASSWGATDAGFTWPEVEARLVGAGILRRATVAVSAGGDSDRALDLDDDGQALAREIAARCARRLHARLIEPADFEASVRARLDAFDEARGTRPIAAFVNVGGTEAALGRSTAILKIRNGWIGATPFDSSPGRGLVARMVEQGVPVLHVLNVRDLAVRWGIL
ncbi:MAG: poly-gamma-glutamate system protein [Vicinamibacterales bacterium]|jgi:poly-gamma-glutamate system protein|nr:poly-gamma-glutamate system protein [Vicinamibacterales bacterium]